MKSLLLRLFPLKLLCAMIGHPPITSLAWDGKVENTAERTTNLLAMRGATTLVNCCCSRKMVSPIWHPWWRKDR